MRIWSAVAVLGLVGGAGGAGCGNYAATRPERTDGQTIMPQRGGRLPTEPYSPVDQPGQLSYDDARITREPEGRGARRADARPTSGAARTLESAVPPLAAPLNGPATTTSSSSTRPAGDAPPGTYVTIGGVVAEVNGQPIYADQVIADLETLLAAQAPQLSESQFKQLAQRELTKQVDLHIGRELLAAAADRLLDQRDKQQGEYLAELWRQREITKAGGSLELARRRYAAAGQNFEQRVRDEHRRVMGMLLLQKEIFPKTTVTAAEMRKYYDEHRDADYTVRDAVQFEMIQVDPAKVGGRDLARQRADEYRARAAAGEDFTALVQYSHGPKLRDSSGELQWIERNAFTFPAVEAAVWQLQGGEVTPVIEEGGKFYIAKLERKRPGRVLPFEEEATQDAIAERLRNQKFRPLYDKMMSDLRQQSIVRTDPGMLQSALEIAMQRYRVWAGK